MNYFYILTTIEAFAKRYCERCPEEPMLWEGHTQLVRQYAVRLAEIEGADRQVVELAALLHDIGKCKGHPDHQIHSVDLAEELLDTLDFSESKKTLILKCILTHRTQSCNEETELELKIVQSADMLGTLFAHEWQEHSVSRETLLKIERKAAKKLKLESARSLAAPQLEKLRKLLKSYPDT